MTTREVPPYATYKGAEAEAARRFGAENWQKLRDLRDEIGWDVVGDEVGQGYDLLNQARRRVDQAVDQIKVAVKHARDGLDLLGNEKWEEHFSRELGRLPRSLEVTTSLLESTSKLLASEVGERMKPRPKLPSNPDPLPFLRRVRAAGIKPLDGQEFAAFAYALIALRLARTRSSPDDWRTWLNIVGSAVRRARKSE